VFAVVLVVLVAGGAAAFVLLGKSRAEEPGAQDTGLPPNTAEVSRKTLKDTQEIDGELGYGTTTTATSRLPGTVTALPDSGSTIARGAALYAVDALPVTLLYGELAAYRTLAEGVEGTDVRQFEENLSALGYTGFTVDEEYTAATADTVEQWQEDLGVEETGTVDLGRVVFAPGEVRVDGLQTAEGEPTGPGKPVLTYTGTAKAVTVELPSTDRELAKPGAEVAVGLPGGETAAGRVGEVTTKVVPASDPGGEPQTVVAVTVGIADQKSVEGYSTASVDVVFTAGLRENVLTVPVAALLALQEGGFGVEVVRGTTSSYVPVRTGMFADGLVEVTGDGIAEGTVVGMPA
jgi:hypothetical protein